MTRFGEKVSGFLREADRQGLRVLMVGGGAVNFHGYQRHSADINLWIDASKDNFERLVSVLCTLGYELERLPDKVLRQEQNISIKISPDMDIEIITRFDTGKSFDEAWASSESTELAGEPVAIYRILGYDDLIVSKLRSARPKDLLDIQELTRKRG